MNATVWFWTLFWLPFIILTIQIRRLTLEAAALLHQEPKNKTGKEQKSKLFLVQLFRKRTEANAERLGTFWMSSNMKGSSSSCSLARFSALSKQETLDSKFPSFAKRQTNADFECSILNIVEQIFINEHYETKWHRNYKKIRFTFCLWN